MSTTTTTDDAAVIAKLRKLSEQALPKHAADLPRTLVQGKIRLLHLEQKGWISYDERAGWSLTDAGRKVLK